MEGGFLLKGIYRERGLFNKKGKVQGPRGKTAPSSSSRYRKTEEGAQGRRRQAGGLRGSSAPGEKGKREGRPRGIDSPPHLERGWGVVACPWWCAVAGGDGRGGSVARRGRGLAAADELEEVEGVLPLPSPRAEGQRGGLATRAGGRRAG